MGPNWSQRSEPFALADWLREFREERRTKRRERGQEPLFERIRKAQRNRCYLCNRPFQDDYFKSPDWQRQPGPLAPTRDHVLPQAREGRNDSNILLAHSRCNHRKHCRAPFACEVFYLHMVNEIISGEPVRELARAIVRAEG